MGLKCLRRRHSVRATSTTTVTTTTSATTTSSYLDVALVFPSPTPLSSFNISPSLPPPSHSFSLSLILSRRFGKRPELAILFTLEVILLYCVSIGFNPVGRPAVNSIFAAIIVTTTIYYIFFYTTSL